MSSGPALPFFIETWGSETEAGGRTDSFTSSNYVFKIIMKKIGYKISTLILTRSQWNSTTLHILCEWVHYGSERVRWFDQCHTASQWQSQDKNRVSSKCVASLKTQNIIGKWVTTILSINFFSFKKCFHVYWIFVLYKFHDFPRAILYVEENLNDWFKLQFHHISCDLGQMTYLLCTSVSSFVMQR